MAEAFQQFITVPRPVADKWVDYVLNIWTNKSFRGQWYQTVWKTVWCNNISMNTVVFKKNSKMKTETSPFSQAVPPLIHNWVYSQPWIGHLYAWATWTNVMRLWQFANSDPQPGESKEKQLVANSEKNNLLTGTVNGSYCQWNRKLREYQALPCFLSHLFLIKGCQIVTCRAALFCANKKHAEGRLQPFQHPQSHDTCNNTVQRHKSWWGLLNMPWYRVAIHMAIQAYNT